MTAVTINTHSTSKQTRPSKLGEVELLNATFYTYPVQSKQNQFTPNLNFLNAHKKIEVYTYPDTN